MPPFLFPDRFFPDAAFGWYFYAVLVLFLAAAAYIDFSSLRIPKWLTISLLGLGVAFSVARGAGLGWKLANSPTASSSESATAGGAGRGPDQPARTPRVGWLPAGTWSGALYGLLFALLGFAVSFGMFYLLWILGMAGGGDVKLFAAVGAWVGPVYFLFIFIGTAVVMLVIGVLQIVRNLSTRGAQKTLFSRRGASSLAAAAKGGRRPGGKGGKKGLRPRERLMTYALPVAVSTALVLPVCFNHDLGLDLFGQSAAAGAAGR